MVTHYNHLKCSKFQFKIGFNMFKGLNSRGHKCVSMMVISGCGLMEIISEPEISNGTDAAAYIRELRKILMTIDTCDGKMSGKNLSHELHHEKTCLWHLQRQRCRSAAQ